MAKTNKIGHLKAVIRHPLLILHLNESEPELAKRHAAIDLEKAEFAFDEISKTTWNPSLAVRAFKDRIPCYGNAYLYAFCRHYRPNIVVETGVHYGGSSAFILKALAQNDSGHLYSIDLPDQSYQRDDLWIQHDALPYLNTTGYAVPSNLRTRWTLITGEARRELPRLARDLGRVDLFHHDSNHTYDHMYFEYQTIWPFIKEGGILASDDVIWNQAFGDFCSSKFIEPTIVDGAGFVFKPQRSWENQSAPDTKENFV